MENDPLPSWIKTGTDVKLEGQIYRQESKEKTILLYLNQVKIKSDHDFKFPKNVDVYKRQGLYRRIIRPAKDRDDKTSYVLPRI